MRTLLQVSAMFAAVLLLFAGTSYAEYPDTLWTRAYGGDNWEEGYGVTVTSDGGFAIVGHTYSYGAGDADVYLVKVDPVFRHVSILASTMMPFSE